MRLPSGAFAENNQGPLCLYRNICRPPTAEGVMLHKVKALGMEQHFEIDLAGTTAYHTGERADPRSTEHAQFRGYNLYIFPASKARRLRAFR